MAVEDDIAELTKELVKFRTETGDQDEIAEALDFVEEYFSGTGLQSRRYEFDDVENLVLKTDEDPEVMLHGHIDVVPAEDGMYEPGEEEGKIYGRGAADMKSGVAALMKLVKEKAQEDDVSVGLMITGDEETGGFKGAAKLSDKYEPDFFISAEPNNTNGYLEIINRQKGVMKITISAEGENAHAARPWNGENAAEKLWEKYSRLRKNFSTRKQDWGTTVNLGTFSSGEASNVVPGEAEAELDVRFTQKYPPEKIKSDMEAIEGLEFDVRVEEAMLSTDEDEDYVQELKEASEDATGEEVAVTRKEPASDARHFSGKGVPSVVFGPEGYHVHEDGEYAVKESFADYYRALENFLDRV